MPPIDIILVNYNGMEYLQLCLYSVKANTSYSDYSIYIWDNSSEEPDLAMLRLYNSCFSDVNVTFHNKNIGPIAAWNRVIQQLKDKHGSLGGRYVVFLGEDVVCRRNWLNTLVMRADTDSQVGIVSFGNLCNPQVPSLQEVPHFSFDCPLVRGECIEDLGGFDGRFFYAFADGDFCNRAKEKGWKIVATPENLATHFGACIIRKIEDWPETLARDYKTLGRIQRGEI